MNARPYTFACIAPAPNRDIWNTPVQEATPLDAVLSQLDDSFKTWSRARSENFQGLDKLWMEGRIPGGKTFVAAISRNRPFYIYWGAQIFDNDLECLNSPTLKLFVSPMPSPAYPKEPQEPDKKELQEMRKRDTARFLRAGGTTQDLVEDDESVAWSETTQFEGTEPQKELTRSVRRVSHAEKRLPPRTVLARFEGQIEEVEGERAQLYLVGDDGSRFRISKPVSLLSGAGVPPKRGQMFDYWIEQLDVLEVSRERFRAKAPRSLTEEDIRRIDEDIRTKFPEPL